MPAPLDPTAFETQGVPRRRWFIACLLGFGILVNYFDRVNLSVSKDALNAAFGISAVTFGYLSSAYNWTYAALQLPSGLLLDKFGVRRVGWISTFIWSVATFGAALSTGIAGFFSARFLLGIGEAPTFPANSKAVGYWFPAQERSLATAIFDSMAKFSSAIGVPLIGILLLHFGWRWSFAATGFLSLLFFALFYAYYYNPSEDKHLSNVERGFIAKGGAQPEDRATAAKGAPLWYLLRQKRVCGLALGFAGYNYTFYLLLTWLPSYFFGGASRRFVSFGDLHERAVALRHVHGPCNWRLDGRCVDSARMECGSRPPGDFDRRDRAWPGDSWRCAYRKRGHSALLDQPFDRRIIGCVACGMVDPFADCSKGKRRHRRRNPEF